MATINMITRQLLRPLAAASSKQWICPTCSVAIASTLQTQPSARIPPQRRSLHTRPPLNYDEHFNKEGVNGLFTSQGYRMGWEEYQDLIIQKLNQLAAATGIESKDVKDLALRSAHNPQTASTFNHASMAHNNHFFYQQFAPMPRRLEQYPDLYASLVEHFGSLDTLREQFIQTAAGMFGPGFVWLVWARDPDHLSGMRDGSWRIMCTYNAGTPYPEAGFMQQGLDMNTNNQLSFTQYQRSNMGYFGQHSEFGKDRARIPPGGTSVMPVLCVSTWEHTYIVDHGLKGKRRYLDSFWDVIDWQVVSNRAPNEISTARYTARRS